MLATLRGCLMESLAVTPFPCTAGSSSEPLKWPQIFPTGVTLVTSVEPSGKPPPIAFFCENSLCVSVSWPHLQVLTRRSGCIAAQLLCPSMPFRSQLGRYSADSGCCRSRQLPFTITNHCSPWPNLTRPAAAEP